MEIESEMTGSLWKVLVETGGSVEVGQAIAILESMKMEIPVLAPVSGKIVEWRVVESASVQVGDVIAVVD